jgi:hypothetical protein
MASERPKKEANLKAMIAREVIGQSTMKDDEVNRYFVDPLR